MQLDNIRQESALDGYPPCDKLHYCAIDGNNKFLTLFHIKPRHSRSAAAYSRQTFPWTICRSVRTYVRASVGRSV